MNECTCECEQPISHPSMKDHNWIVFVILVSMYHRSANPSQIQLWFLTEFYYRRIKSKKQFKEKKQYNCIWPRITCVTSSAEFSYVLFDSLMMSYYTFTILSFSLATKWNKKLFGLAGYFIKFKTYIKNMQATYFICLFILQVLPECLKVECMYNQVHDIHFIYVIIYNYMSSYCLNAFQP